VQDAPLRRRTRLGTPRLLPLLRHPDRRSHRQWSRRTTRRCRRQAHRGQHASRNKGANVSIFQTLARRSLTPAQSLPSRVTRAE
jgi:hypothetical protein